MEIKKTVEGKILTLEIDGRLDTLTSPTLQNEINSSIEGIEHLVLDFKKLVYISSAGLRVVLSVQKEKIEYISSAGLRIILRMKKENKSFKIINVSSEVYEIFEMTGFSEILNLK